MSQDKSFHVLILEKISEIGERTARMEAEQQNMKDDLEEVKRQDVEQNKLLAEHIQGVKTQAERLDNEIQIRKMLEAKVSILEEAPKFRALLTKYIIWIGSISGAVIATIELLKFL